MAASYEVEQILEKDHTVWCAFIEQSPQYTPFMRDDFLQAVGFTCDKYLVSRKGIPVVGLCIPISMTGEQMTVPYAPYQGLLYRSTMDSHATYKEHLEAVSALLAFLDGKYNKIHFCNHYTVEDIRAVLWHHYHTPQQGKYKVELKYTAIKALSKDLLDGANENRKTDYMRSRTKWNLKIIANSDNDAIGCFMNLYIRTFAREDIILSENDLSIVRSILENALKHGYGMLRCALTPEGEAVGSVFSLYDRMHGYGLFYANHPTYRKYGGGTLLLLETMRELRENGVRDFDFVGANSPLRGDFKLSFGASLKPYYVCSFTNNNY